MKLNHTKEVMISVDYDDLEDLIREVYGKPFQIVADQEWDNDSHYSFAVKKEKLEAGDLDELKSFKEDGKYMNITNILLTDMCNNGIIDEGEYLIAVCW